MGESPMTVHTIWKFATALDAIGNVNTIPMPRGADILSVGKQGLAVCLWARVNPKAPNEVRFFAFVGTGKDAPSAGRFLGTTQFDLGQPLVVHVFEVDGL